MNAKKEVPVLLLTGYLGSGKTTLLNKILANEKGIKFAVIVNDIGEVNIDAALIEKGGVVGQKDDSLVSLEWLHLLHIEDGPGRTAQGNRRHEAFRLHCHRGFRNLRACSYCTDHLLYPIPRSSVHREWHSAP